jgi:serine/threonine protein kinase
LSGLSFYINFEELTLQTKVGEGGFGEVFLGTWNGKKIAVKKLSVKHYKNRENICRFINEINVISSLRHPNIVLYIGASIDKDDYYMITEYLPRGSLFDYMRKEKSKFTEREQINIAYEMAVALNYLHSRSVVHCDLKSSNILIDDNWKIKIGDFGLSQFIKENEYNRGKIGTPHWMAPEILKGGIYEYSSDVYSFGMILWEILKMEIPYYGLNPYQIYNLVVQDKKIVDIPKEGHEVLIDILRKCLNYEPQKRPSLKELVQTLEKLKTHNKNIDTNFEDLYEFLY